MFSNIRGVVFDLDGTLIDSAPDIVANLNEVLVRRGVEPFAPDAVRSMIGGGAMKLLERAWRALDRDPPDALSEQYQEFITAYSARPTEHTTPFPGAEEVLLRLRDAGVAVGLCTNKPEAITRRILDDYGWTSHFAAVIGGDTTPERKPDPTPMSAALNAMNVSPGEAVMVGDSAPDVGAARAVGAACILVSFGYSRVPIGELGGDAVVDDLCEVWTLLGR